MRKKKVLVALLLVFLAPGILAIIFYMHPSWLGGLPTNKGAMIRPPVQLSMLKNNDKWHMVVLCAEGCDDKCLKTVDEMARVRLALGRRLYQVDLSLLLREKDAMCPKKTEDALRAGAITITHSKTVPALFSGESAVFLADPLRYAVLAYPADGKPEDVFQDLKRLLSTREQA